MKLGLRPATIEDCELLFYWVNDDEVRRNAFNSRSICLKEHEEWFAGKLNGAGCFIFIGFTEEFTVGQIRVDMENDTGIIDYSIAGEYRGKGYGTCLLEEIVKEMKNRKTGIRKLVGRVKYSNAASARAFEKASYKLISGKEYMEKEYMEYEKLLE